jgi:hypothetical protein
MCVRLSLPGTLAGLLPRGLFFSGGLLLDGVIGWCGNRDGTFLVIVIIFPGLSTPRAPVWVIKSTVPLGSGIVG